MPVRPRSASALLVGAVVAIMLPGTVRAEPGGLDPSFGGGDGLATFDTGGDDAAQKMLLQPNGKIVVAGEAFTSDHGQDVFVARYLPDGTADPAFGGGDGVVTVDFARGYDTAWGLDRMDDGRIVVAGYAEDPANTFAHVAVARFTRKGAPDPTFGDGGIVTTAVQGYQRAFGWRCIVQPNGKVVVAGSADAGNGGDFLVLRYLEDGSLDPSFGEGGVVTLDNDGADDGAWDVRETGGGGLLVSGWTETPDEARIVILWMTPSGSLDRDVGGGDGQAILDIAPGNHVEYARASFVQPDGSVVVVGEAANAVAPESLGDIFMARVTPDGELDPSFGDGGVVASDGPGDELMFSAKRAPGGAVAAAGFTGAVMYAVRFRPNGHLDRSLGQDGFAIPTLDSSRGSDVVDLRGQDRILLTGELEDNAATARLRR